MLYKIKNYIHKEIKIILASQEFSGALTMCQSLLNDVYLSHTCEEYMCNVYVIIDMRIKWSFMYSHTHTHTHTHTQIPGQGKQSSTKYSKNK